MSIKYFAIFGVTVAAALAWAPLTIQANAHGSGFKMHSGHFGKHFPHFRHGARNRNFNQWWPYAGYGGVYAVPPYDYGTVNYVEPPPVIYVSQPPAALTCQTTKEVKTVPSENGGTRDITITRC